MKHSILSFIAFILVAVCVSLTTGCSTSAPVKTTYEREIQPRNALAGTTLTLDTQFFKADGTPDGRNAEAVFNKIFSDAAVKHGMQVSDNQGDYRLESLLKVPQGKEMFSATPEAAKNLSIAVIPLAGPFMKRYYTIGTHFTLYFNLYKGAEVVHTDQYVSSLETTAAVHPAARGRQTHAAVANQFHDECSKAVERFYRSLAEKYPAGTQRP
jgi:hypothetical protein